MKITSSLSAFWTGNIPPEIDSSSRLSDEPGLGCIRKLTTMRFFCSLVLLFILSALVQDSLQQCYNHDGGIMPHDIKCAEYASDNDSAVPCCESGRSCLPNGMCSNSETDPNPMQASCTDNSWKSPHCPKFCTCKLLSYRL